MASVTSNATVVAKSGLGPTTYIYAIATGTITTALACDAITTTYGGTIAAVEGVANGNHVAVQGGPGGAEAVSGISLVATFGA
tara:strand:+ start:81 stop:329 length:249 start_codon:yes stop_codon:yes gene_type:complete